MPREARIAAREAAAMPFPREETTPPVTNTNLVMGDKFRKLLVYRNGLARTNRRRSAGLAAALRDERPESRHSRPRLLHSRGSSRGTPCAALLKSSFPRRRESIFRHPGEGHHGVA